MPLTDASEIIRTEVRSCRIFGIFSLLNLLKLQRRRSYFPPFSNLRAATLIEIQQQIALDALVSSFVQ